MTYEVYKIEKKENLYLLVIKGQDLEKVITPHERAEFGELIKLGSISGEGEYIKLFRNWEEIENNIDLKRYDIVSGAINAIDIEEKIYLLSAASAGMAKGAVIAAAAGAASGVGSSVVGGAAVGLIGGAALGAAMVGPVGAVLGGILGVALGKKSKGGRK